MKKNKGFTLVELSVVLGIMAILLTMASLNISNFIPISSTNNTTQIFIADLKQQQIKALSGDTEGRSGSDNYGIYFSTNSYTLFHGSTYNANDTSNFSVSLDHIQVSTNLPGGTIIFKKNSGQIDNYQNPTVITLTQTDTQGTKIITISKYGAVESII